MPFGHNIRTAGSPGAGKTLLARALPGILPAMSIAESLDVTRIYSVADQLPAGMPLIRHRSFRAPHHTMKRISGTLLDRIDIHIEVLGVDYEKLSGDRMRETFDSIRARVQTARDIQTKRYSSIRNSSAELSDIVCNADMRIGEIWQFCKLLEDAHSLMRAAMSQLNLSARAYHRTQSVKLARKIADLAGCEEIQSVHLAEALHASRPPEFKDQPALDYEGSTQAIMGVTD